MKVCLIGCVEFSKYALLKLIEIEKEEVIELVGVVTKRTSKFNSDFVDIAHAIRELNSGYSEDIIHYYQDSDSLVEFLQSVKADVVYCFGWSNLLTEGVLNAAPKGVIGFHPALLPMNRGRHPIIWALVLGLSETASTFFRMDKEADSGPILSQEEVTISIDDNARTLYDKIINVAMQQIDSFTRKLASNSELFIEQDHSLANNWRKRSPHDGLIDWRMSAQDIHNLVRALAVPYPGAEFHLKDGEPIKVWQTSLALEVPPANLEPGKVLKVLDERVLVKCARNTALWLEMTCPRLKVNVGEYLF